MRHMTLKAHQERRDKERPPQLGNLKLAAVAGGLAAFGFVLSSGGQGTSRIPRHDTHEILDGSGAVALLAGLMAGPILYEQRLDRAPERYCQKVLQGLDFSTPEKLVSLYLVPPPETTQPQDINLLITKLPPSLGLE